jgi:hypothetical protein
MVIYKNIDMKKGWQPSLRPLTMQEKDPCYIVIGCPENTADHRSCEFKSLSLETMAVKQ